MKHLTILSLLIVLSTGCVKDVLLNPGNGPSKPTKKPPVINYSPLVNTLTVGTPFSLIATNTGGASTQWSVSPQLPAGITINATSGTISGTPTTVTAAANYVVTAKNNDGSSSVIVTITVATTTVAMPDNATFKVILQDDTLASYKDECGVIYNHLASKNYVAGEDAIITQPGNLHFETMAYVPPPYDPTGYYTMAWNERPYDPNDAIPCSMGTRATGSRTYTIAVTYNTMPSNFKIWIRDKYAKDSLDITNPTVKYHFSASMSDTASVGNYRFQIVTKSN